MISILLKKSKEWLGTGLLGDENKMNIANNIKTMAYNAGINIEIIALTADEIEQRVESLDYDIVLSTIYLNETPDIRFLQNYLHIFTNFVKICPIYHNNIFFANLKFLVIS